MQSKGASDRQKRVLTELLARPGNNVCADCMSPAPRWASWNLGVFLCVNCATAHRKLGSHISKIKSVTLDTWTKEQIEAMEKMGNLKANAIYNPDPLRNPPPTDLEDSGRDSELETYVRNKYQYKAWMKRDDNTPTEPSRKDRDRPPKVLVRGRGTPSPGSTSYREHIDAVSPIASSLMAEMENHTREQRTRGSSDRSRSSRPSTATGGSTTEAPFTSVGVTPNDSKRPSTATARLNSTTSVPKITTTPPGAGTKPGNVPASGGFSWAPARTPEPTLASTSVPPSAAAPVKPEPAALPAATPTPAPPTPEPKRSLYEEDMLALQNGMTNPASAVMSNQMPLNSVPPSFTPGAATNLPLGSPFSTSSLPGSGPFITSGGVSNVSNLATGLGNMGLGATPPMLPAGPSLANPFNSTFQGGVSPFSSLTSQPTGMYANGPSPHNPFGMQTQPTGQMQPPFQTSSPFQASPFQAPSQFQPTGISPSQFSVLQQPNGTFTSGSSFTSTTPQPLSFQQPQYTGMQSAFSSNTPATNNFAAFANGMLPQAQQVQQPNQMNPFMRQQTGMGMGVNGWRG